MKTPSHIDALLAEDQWARRLARALVRGTEDPEDLVQEAYVRSVAHFAGPPRPAPAEPRAWLGRVLRNVLAELRRARGTREHRELEHARPVAGAGAVDGEPTPDELAARAEVQERLAAAVLALEPRQRDVVLLRHFDGASVADIARRLGLARATVHEHLERGHAELRRVLLTMDDDRRMSRGLALLVATGDAPRAVSVAAAAVAVSASPSLPLFLIVMNVTKSLPAVALVAALSFVAWRAVAPPDDAPSTLEETEAVTMEASAPDSPNDEAPLQVADTGATRAALATPVAPRSESGTATLRVRVVDEDNVGIHLARVLVSYDGEPRDTSTAPAAPDTDRDGLWSETVPAGKELDVSVWHQEASSGKVTVAALADDATFETTVRVRTRPDLDLALTIVDAATRAPIDGARVFLESMRGGSWMSGRDVSVLRPGAASNLVSAVDGTVRVRVKSWHTVWCRVHADGFAPLLQTVHRHSTTESDAIQAVTLTLTRGARVLGRVSGAPVPAEVRARFPGDAIEAPEIVPDLFGGPFSARSFELRVAVDDAGQFLVPDVPGGTTVALALHDASSGALLYEPAAPLVTVAGEDHHVTWDLGARRRVVCTVREADGTPAGGIQVLLFARGDARVGATPDGGRASSQSARTDEAGVALLDAVAPGAWLVGLAPSGKGDDAFAAYTLAVDVPDAPGDVHVDFVLHRGLFIEGRVIARDGGKPTLFVHAHNERFHLSTHGKEIVDGRFRLGPLLPGLYKVSAMAFTTGDGPSYAPPPEVEVSAGTAEIELVLRPGGKIVLHAIDASSREAVRAEFVLSRVSIDAGYFGGSGAGPSKTYGGLEPGTYCALALASDGRVGVLESISLPSTEPVEAVVSLGPGGTLVLRAPLDGLPRDVYVMRGDGVVALHQLERSAEERSVLPSGRYRVGVKQRPRDQLRSANAPRFDAVFEVDVVVGEEVKLDVAPE